MANRYKKILDLIDIFQPESIVETGVWNGENAIRMIATAQNYSKNVTYIGYDLFEDGNAELDALEFNIKPHNTLEAVKQRITEMCPNAYINLIRGNTRETLKPVTVDFAFIDGGHSLETIKHDYEMLRGCSVIVLDDYYLPDENGEMPDISKVGCNRIVGDLPHAIIDTGDKVATGGTVALAVVFGG
jgi:predicted O-methyltransferase YrrM